MGCPINQCLNGGKCSTRLNGNYSCQCFSPYNGTNCQLGFFFIYFYYCYLNFYCFSFSLFLFFSFSHWINRRIREKWTNNFDKFL